MMGYEEIFKKANELINILSLVDSNDLVYYIIDKLVEENGYCSKEGYKDYLNQKYGIE